VVPDVLKEHNAFSFKGPVPSKHQELITKQHDSTIEYSYLQITSHHASQKTVLSILLSELHITSSL